MSILKIPDVLDTEIMDSILNDPRVIRHYQEFEKDQQKNSSTFSYPISNGIRQVFTTRLGMDLEKVTHLPMKWARGNHRSHVDVGSEPFEKTCLLYLSDCKGSLYIENEAYEMKKNMGYVFDQGMVHGVETMENTTPRLLIGPMSQKGLTVGLPTVGYYYTNNDPITSVTEGTIFLSGSYINTNIEPTPPNTVFGGWYISAISEFATDYNVGDIVQPGQTYNNQDSMALFPYYINSSICFGEDTEILCLTKNKEEKYIPIHKIRKGDKIKTYKYGYKKVDMIGTSKIYNPGNNHRCKNRLYKCSSDNYPEIKKELFITGCHSILVKELSKEERNETLEILGKIYVTDQHYRLMACVDRRAQPYEVEGLYNIWHLALENEDYYMNYGIYANGLLVETTSQRMLKELSGMTLI